MKIKLFLFAAHCLCVCVSLPAGAQYTANQHVKPYYGQFEYGCNLMGNKNGWNDTALVSLVSAAGGHTIRPTLPEAFLEQYGYNIRLNEFGYYKNQLGMKEVTCFIQQPSAAHAEKAIYPGCTQPSKLFANLYQPIWKNDGTVNPNNYYAVYVYKLLQTYGTYVKFWEVVNEPDLVVANTYPDNWLLRAPLPAESVNTQAPFFSYIRTLRITWEVVKKFRPNAYVTTGGIGAYQYLDALLRYTDNPVNGAVSPGFPVKGGAYFDVVSYHCYPGYYLRYWDNLISGFRYTRNSDFAAAKIIDAKNAMQTTLAKYGYDGSLYPKKHFILTETNISRRTREWRYGSDTMQRNFGIKALVLAQKNNIKQLYFYTVGEQTDAPAQSTPVVGNDEYFLMGLYENLYRDKPGNVKLTQLGTAVKTTSTFLYGYKFDAAQTVALSLPASIEGGAFRKQGHFVYVLWAKDPLDRSENYNVEYSFPAALNMIAATRAEWDFSVTKNASPISTTHLTLHSSPSFFVPSGGRHTQKNDIALNPAGEQSSSRSALWLRVNPNPVTGSGTIDYYLRDAAFISITITGMDGRRKFLLQALTREGENKLTFSTEGLQPGVYSVTLATAIKRVSTKVVIVH